VVIDSLADQCTSSNADNEASASDDSVPLAEGTTTGSGNSTNSTIALINLDSSDESTVHVKQKPKESTDIKPQVDVKPIISSKKKVTDK